MVKEQLLAAIDTDVRYGRVALALAKRFDSAAELRAEYTRWERNCARLLLGRRVSGLLGLLLFATFIGCFAIAKPGMDYRPFVNMGFLAGAATLVAGLVASLFEKYRAQLAEELPLLRPIAGSYLCVSALELVETGDENVIEWRDRAVAERDVLHGFDVRVMEFLLAQSEALKDKAARQARIDDACRKVHGVPTSATLG